MLIVPVPSLIRLVASISRADEHHAGGDVLGAIGVMLADIAFGVAEFVGEQERLAILAQRLPPILVERMDRHGEEAEVHRVTPGPRPSRTFLAGTL